MNQFECVGGRFAAKSSCCSSMTLLSVESAKLVATWKFIACAQTADSMPPSNCSAFAFRFKFQGLPRQYNFEVQQRSCLMIH